MDHVSSINEKKQLRIFGLIWSFIFAVFAFYPLLKGKDLSVIPLALCVFFLVSSVFYPRLYKKVYFYQAWIKCGDFIGKINSYILICILFYGIFVPISFVLKAFGKDLLGKRMDKTADSYFIDRKDEPQDMKNQF